MHSFMIREACADDAPQILAYLKQVGAETDNLTFGAEGIPVSLADERRFIQSVKDAPHSVMYVAVKCGCIVAVGSLSGMARRMAHRAELGISVAKAEWGKGIGSALMERLIRYAKENNIELINLEVRTDNCAAIHLYKKYGFQKIGVFPAFFKTENQYADFTLMYLDLR